MSPLAACVLALLAGCLIGGAVPLSPEPAARVLVLSAGVVLVAARLAWAGHGAIALTIAAMGAAGAGVAMASLSEASRWAPPGVDVEAMEQATARGDVLRVAGVLRRDAWISRGGGVALDIHVTHVSRAGVWTPTSLGVRATVVGGSALRVRLHWTRGRIVHATLASVRRPLPYRNFGVPDAERALARNGVRVFATIKSASMVEATPGPWWEESAAHARAAIRRVIATHIRDPPAAATMAAILIGDRSDLDQGIVRDLQHAGVYHVVAISGGNVAIWLAVLLWLPHASGMAVRAGVWWLASGLMAFAAVVDGGASVTRAVLAAGAILSARWWDLRTPGIQALAVAAGLQWLIDPLAWQDAGCVLSFGAAGALVVLASAQVTGHAARQEEHGWRRLRRAVLALTMATLAIEIVLLPISARWFQLATAAGLLANVVAVPAMAAVQLAGLALVPAALLSARAADAVGFAATYGVQALLGSAGVVAIAPWLVRDVPPPSVAVLCLHYGAVAAALCAWLCRRRGAALLGMVPAVGCLAWIVSGGIERSAPAPWTWPAAARWQHETWPAEPWLLVAVLDVGQGDATLVRFPSGRTWLVDAGGSVAETFDVGARVTSPALWALGLRRLDRVLITHMHPDHAGGMASVIERFRPRELLIGISPDGDALEADVSGAAAAMSVTQRPLSAGEWFADGPVRVSVLHPERPDWERRRVRNDDSIVLWVRMGDVGVWLPGDISEAVERRIAPRIAPAPLTLVRLAHHGSASSTGEALLEALRPALAIGSMARNNRFGHPAPRVLARLRQHGVPLLRTDRDGAILLATNGRVLLVRTAAGGEISMPIPP